MKITYNFLKEFVFFEESPFEIAEILNSLGIGVKEIKSVGEKLENKLKVVKIEKISPLENKELYLCEINDGEKNLQVVCGAKNVREGMKTIYAPPGTEIKGEIIGIREFGKIKSYGMLVSLDEIEIGEEREGIVEIEDDFKVGEDPFPKLFLPDYVLELEITPNRPDLLGIIGIAREIATYKRISFRLPKANPKINLEIPEFEIEVKDYDLCPRYTGRIIKNVKVKKSPLKLQIRLFLCGLRPINNVVDITNITMLETSQPLHAFDLDKLKEKIIVRRAKNGEKMLCLDGIERELDESILVIADKERPVAIAGIIGGEETKIDENTKNVFLESAYFNPISIRKSRRKLKIDTESSYRFERGTWWDGVSYASDRATKLLEEICGGISGIVTDVKKRDREERVVFLREERIEKVLGEKIGIKEAKEILNGLGLKVKSYESDKIFFIIPSYRNDLSIEEDLIEEIARHYGYEK
ncbi:MAG: phenylalanine--tRNA ligase subunit beta, partial [candidate division WOR-3 bacterium]